MTEPLLRVESLSKSFPIGHHRSLWAVQDVCFSIRPGEIFGLVGESGSGKSTLARTIAGLYPPTHGRVFLQDLEISNPKTAARQRKHIAHTLQFLFQDSMASLNPRMTIGALIEEPMVIHREGTRAQRRETALRLMALVGLDPALYHKYPAEFSGGMRQRVCIARALSLSPQLIIADEPIASLDVSMQAQIINLFASLCREQGVSFLFIAHDLSMVRHISHRIGVLCHGRLVELATADTLCTQPLHPYTRSLLSSVYTPDPGIARSQQRIPFDSALFFEQLPQCAWQEAAPGHFVLLPQKPE